MAQNNYNWPINPTTVNSGPVQFEINGIPTTVNIDTVTPANSKPLPVLIYGPTGLPISFNNDYGASAGALRTAAQIGNTTGAANFGAGATGAQTLRVEANQGAANATPWNVSAAQSGTWNIGNITGTVSLPTGASTSALQTAGNTTLTAISGQLPATLGQKTSANSLSTVLASDQPAIPTKAPVNTNGNIVNQTLSATTAQSNAAPANAVGFILEADSTNTNNIRWCIGGTASATVGSLAEPGRDSGYVPCAASISVCATVSGTNTYSIQWILSA